MDCEICNGSMRPYSRFGKFEISKCSKCGFGRANVSISDVENLYEGKYFDIYYGEKESAFGQSKKDELRVDVKIDSSKIWWIDEFLPGDDINVLEVGPGASAAVYKYLEGTRKKVTYEAVEFSNVACEALQKLELTSHQGLLYDAKVGEKIKGRFDYVVATEVIEHDLNPRQFVSGLFDALVPGGRACLTTGNFDGLTARIMKGRWYYLHPPVHVCFYSPKSVNILFKEAGFKSVKADCLGWNYYKLYTKFPIPGFLSVVRALQIPTGMTIWAEK